MTPSSSPLRRRQALGLIAAGSVLPLLAACGAGAASVTAPAIATTSALATATSTASAAPASVASTRSAATAASAVAAARATSSAIATSSAATPAAGKKASIRVVTELGAGPDLNAFTAATKAFEQASGVTVELVPSGNDQQIFTQISAGTAPDAFRGDHQFIPEHAASGWLRDLSPYFATSSEVKTSDYFPNYVNYMTYEGKIWAIPEDFQPASVLYYNANLLQQHGQTAPTDQQTFADVRQTALTLAKQNADPTAAIWGWTTDDWMWRLWWYSWGGDIANAKENPTKFTFNTPEGAAGLGFYLDGIYKDHAFPSDAELNKTKGGVRTVFGQGRVGMYEAGTWVSSTFLQQAQGVTWKISLGPKGSDGKPHYITGGAGWGMAQEGKNPDASWQWLEWQFGAKGWKIWIDTRDPKTFWLPCQQQMAQYNVTILNKYYDNVQAVIDSAQYVQFVPKSPKWQSVLNAVTPVITNIFAQKVELKAGLEQMDQVGNAALNQK